MIDDLDRCEPDQMLAVIESIRLFLDDEEMSRRLQVAMLIDRRILRHAILHRARKSEFLEKGSPQEQRFFRSQEEKLFVVSLELPPLNSTQATELAQKIVSDENRANTPSKETVPPHPDTNAQPAPDTTATPTAGDQKFAETEDTPSPTIAGPTPPETDRTSNPGVDPVPVQTGRTKTPPATGQTPVKTSEPAKPTQAVLDAKFSDYERSLLIEVAGKVPASELTPRSYRSFVLRYQLARLIFSTFHNGSAFEPSELIAILSAGIFGTPKLPAANLDPRILAAVSCVLGPETAIATAPQSETSVAAKATAD